MVVENLSKDSKSHNSDSNKAKLIFFVFTIDMLSLIKYVIFVGCLFTLFLFIF